MKRRHVLNSWAKALTFGLASPSLVCFFGCTDATSSADGARIFAKKQYFALKKASKNPHDFKEALRKKRLEEIGAEIEPLSSGKGKKSH